MVCFLGLSTRFKKYSRVLAVVQLTRTKTTVLARHKRLNEAGLAWFATYVVWHLFTGEIILRKHIGYLHIKEANLASSQWDRVAWTNVCKYSVDNNNNNGYKVKTTEYYERKFLAMQMFILTRSLPWFSEQAKHIICKTWTLFSNNVNTTITKYSLKAFVWVVTPLDFVGHFRIKKFSWFSQICLW